MPRRITDEMYIDILEGELKDAKQRLAELEAALRDSCRDDRAGQMGGCPLAHDYAELESAAKSVLMNSYRHDSYQFLCIVHVKKLERLERALEDSTPILGTEKRGE